MLLGLHDEAEQARSLIVDKLSFDRDGWVKNFEITIRVLGGLLSAHQMTGDPRLLALADDLGRRLLPAFDSPTGMPYRFVNLATGKTRVKYLYLLFAPPETLDLDQIVFTTEAHPLRGTWARR